VLCTPYWVAPSTECRYTCVKRETETEKCASLHPRGIQARLVGVQRGVTAVLVGCASTPSPTGHMGVEWRVGAPNKANWQAHLAHPRSEGPGPRAERQGPFWCPAGLRGGAGHRARR